MTEENRKNYEYEEEQTQPSRSSGKKKIAMKKSRFVLIIILVFLFGMSAGNKLTNAILTSGGEYVAVPQDSYETLEHMYTKYQKLEQLYSLLDQSYYLEISDEDMMNGIYKGLFESAGDPYTAYLTPEEYESLTAQTTGDFYGIGVTMTISENDEIIIVSTIEGSPAENAGLKTDDIILEVDGVPYRGSELDTAASKLRGELNTRVKVKYRSGDEEKEVTITRKKITTQSVYSEMLDDNIGYIRITQFELATGDDFEKELRSMEMKGVSGVVIDLRSNGGGIVDAGIKVADALLPEATIVYLEDKAGERVYYNSDATCTSVPYVVLVNEGTASTSEIVAAAIKDNEGGKIVGTQTFGKGIVQLLTGLMDGTGATRITVQQYFSPDGNVIHEKGVEPDYVVDLTMEDTEDVQLMRAIELLK